MHRPTVLGSALATLLITGVAFADDPAPLPGATPAPTSAPTDAAKDPVADPKPHDAHDPHAKHPHHGGHGEHAAHGEHGGPHPAHGAHGDHVHAPLAGVHGGVAYFRDPDDNFRVHVQGRMHLDQYNWFGPGVSATTLKSSFALRRVRTELTGELFQGPLQWALHGEWGMGFPGTDNAKGAAGSTAQATTLKAMPADAFVNYRHSGLFNVQLGQFDANFTMENRTSDKAFPFMERSIAVRAFGIPTNKEIGLMAWGETDDKLLFWSLGVYGGDGQSRPNLDGRYDGMARVFTHPLYEGGGLLKDLQIGASFRYGVRDDHNSAAAPFSVLYDYPSMTTQGNYAFWKGSYTSSKGTTHVIPNGVQLGLAGELRIPVGDVFDLTSEFVWLKNGTREAVDGYPISSAERYGTLKGYSYYVQAGFWPLGHRDVQGAPGYENPTHVDFKKKGWKEPPIALQLLLKWEQLSAEYLSADRAGTPDTANVDGKIKVNALSLGANLWLTKHLRLSANYVLNMFPGAAPLKPEDAANPGQTSDQRATAPAQSIGKGIDATAHDTGNVVHEVLFRAAIGF